MYRKSTQEGDSYGGKLEFHLASAWDSQRLLELSQRVNVAAIDTSIILGQDMVSDGIALIKHLENLYEGSLHTVVVKSKALTQHAKQYVNPQAEIDRLKNGTVPTPKPAWRTEVLCTVGVSQYRRIYHRPYHNTVIHYFTVQGCYSGGCLPRGECVRDWLSLWGHHQADPGSHLWFRRRGRHLKENHRQREAEVPRGPIRSM